MRSYAALGRIAPRNAHGAIVRDANTDCHPRNGTSHHDKPSAPATSTVLEPCTAVGRFATAELGSSRGQTGENGARSTSLCRSRLGLQSKKETPSAKAG